MFTAEPVCSWAAYLFATRLRDRGCSAHPVFPAPSLVKRAKEMQNLGQIMPREREVVTILSTVIASAARQSSLPLRGKMDCFVATLLAMTVLRAEATFCQNRLLTNRDPFSP